MSETPSVESVSGDVRSGTPTDPLEPDALDIECAMCGAEVGKPCVNVGGAFKGSTRVEGPHGGRLIAAFDAQAEPDEYDDNWIGTDVESIDAIHDGENVMLLQRLVYKLMRERDAALAAVDVGDTQYEPVLQQVGWGYEIGDRSTMRYGWSFLDPHKPPNRDWVPVFVRVVSTTPKKETL